jgi:gamma-glutamyltranspeptidase / glutathione hydrolase
MVAASRFLVIALVALVVCPASAESRPSDDAPDSTYSLSADAFVRPEATDVYVKVTSSTAPLPDQLEKVQVKIWPRDDGAVDTQNYFDVSAPGGVATLRLPRLALMQRVEVQAHVKHGRQHVLRAETLVQYEQLGAVSTDHPLATQTGKEILEAGGNAFDAAAAVLFVLNVVQPSLAGIGGGSEVVVHVAADGRDYAIVGREQAPSATTPTMYDGQDRPKVGLNGYSVGVPGTLRAVEMMLDRWGTIALADALEPAITHAENGVPVGAFLAKDSALTRTALLQPEVLAQFRPGGVPLEQGSTLVQRDLAETFRLIAREGTSVFYRGEIAEAIVEAQMRTAVGANAIVGGEGRMTRADLASYEVVIRPASHLNYKGYDVYSAPPPTNGGLVLLETLGLLEQRFPIGDVGAGYGFGTRRTIHAMVESLRLAFADRDKWIGDPGVAGFATPESWLLSDHYLQGRAALVNPFPIRMPGVPPPGDPLTDSGTLETVESGNAEGDGHTSHFSVIDRFGNVVSFTTTLRDSFGSGIMVTPYGFVLNNSLSLFNIPAKQAPDPGANNAGPNKRPMGSQTPVVIVKDGEPFAATGTYGAEFIPSLVLNVVLDLIDHRLSLQDAVDASRIWGTLPSGSFSWNYAARPGAPSINQVCPPPPSTACVGEIEELRNIGHIVGRRPTAAGAVFGSLTSVGVDPATLALQGASDSVRQTDATAVVVSR